VRSALLVALVLAGCGEAGPAECAIELAPLADWRLETDGTLLRDALGRVVLLHGVNAGGRSKFAPNVPFDYGSDYAGSLARYMDRAAAWGITVMRVPFTWEAVEPEPGADDAAFLARYDALLDAAWARGIRTIVDFHQDVYADNYCGDGFPSWTLPDPKPAARHDCPAWFQGYGSPEVRAAFDRFWAAGSPIRAAFDAMWDRMVTRHRDRPGVIGFEIMNEPSAGTADEEQFEKTTLTTFTSEVAARMHALAPRALVFFDPGGLTSANSTTHLGRPSGDRLVFAPHYYQAVSLTPLGEGNPDQVAEAVTKLASYGKSWRLPVLLGEFGTSHNAENAAEYTSAHSAALEAELMSGTQWEYSVAVEPWNAEVFSVAAADGSEFPVTAALARPHARSVAGRDLRVAWQHKTATLTLDYVADGGVTEVTLPRGWADARITLDGACADRSRPNLLLIRAVPEAKVHVGVRPR
jgi:endoglycosylceramidase